MLHEFQSIRKIRDFELRLDFKVFAKLGLSNFARILRFWGPETMGIGEIWPRLIS